MSHEHDSLTPWHRITLNMLTCVKINQQKSLSLLFIHTFYEVVYGLKEYSCGTTTSLLLR